MTRLGDWLHCLVFIDNDVNLAVLAERRRGAGAEAESLVFVQWGRRIGCGIYRGHSAAAG